MHRGFERPGHAARVLRRAHEQRHGVARHLRVRGVERVERLGLRQAAQFHVADDADDLAQDARVERQGEAFADGVFAGPEPPGHRLADENAPAAPGRRPRR